MPNTEPEGTGRADSFIHVAAGVLENAGGEILIAKRPDHLHQGGLWEFPGGKLEAGEAVLTALQREFAEEVAITIDAAEPLIRIPWHYPDKAVLLDVWRIAAYSGQARGLEGQTIRWVRREELDHYAFPAANRAILNALRLPARYLISGEFHRPEDFLARLQRGLEQGLSLVQLRAKHLPEQELIPLVNQAKALCATYEARLLVNTTAALAGRLDVGIHLSSRQLLDSRVRPLPQDRMVAASVHNAAELQHANRLGVDFVVISPVLPTRSHPDAVILGWPGLAKLVEQAAMPVYALGGMTEAQLPHATQAGAQGIAAISAFWKAA